MHESRPLLAYFITWTCYGQWLHGDKRGSIDLLHNHFQSAFLPWSEERLAEARERMTQEPYLLDEPRRIIVLAAIQRKCNERGWILHAIHVRDWHVHPVVTADRKPEDVMIALKAAASADLNLQGFDHRERKRWTKHGSTKYICDEDYFQAAVNYTLNKQGEPMQRWPE